MSESEPFPLLGVSHTPISAEKSPLSSHQILKSRGRTFGERKRTFSAPRCIATTNHSSVIARRGGRPRPPVVARKTKDADSSLTLRMTDLLQNKNGTARRPFPTRSRKIDFFGMSWAPSPTNSNVGEHPNRHINVKLKLRHTSRLRLIATTNHSSVIARRGGRPRPPVGKINTKMSLRGEAVAIRNAHIRLWEVTPPKPPSAREVDFCKAKRRREFRGTWMPPSSTNSNVGEHPNRHLNVKHNQSIHKE